MSSGHPCTRIAVIGASGFVGSATVRAARHREEVAEIRELARPDFDLVKPETWRSPFKNVDCVINAAARIDGEDYDVFRVNTLHLRFLIDELQRSRVMKYIELSTGAVYGPANVPADAKSKCSPQGAYAQSKYVAERILQEHFSRHLNILRLYFPYGPNQKPPPLFPRLAAAIRSGEEIVCNRDGGPRFSVSHVDDVAELIIRQFVELTDTTRIHNIASGSTPSLEEISTKISEHLHCQANIIRTGNRDDVLSVPYRRFDWRE